MASVGGVSEDKPDGGDEATCYFVDIPYQVRDITNNYHNIITLLTLLVLH